MPQVLCEFEMACLVDFFLMKGVEAADQVKSILPSFKGLCL